MNSTEIDLDGGWHRVHWFGLIELLFGAAVAVVVLWRTGLPNGIGAWAEEVLGALVGLRAVIAYLRRQYRVTPTVLTWRSGVVFRTEESMRRGDVQSVVTTVPIWYRPFDLMRLVVADGSGNKIEVGPLRTSVAERFQTVMQPAAADTVDAADGMTVTASGGASASASDGDRSIDTETAAVGSATANTVKPVVRRVEVPLWKLIVFSVGDVVAIVAAAAVGAAVYFGWSIAAISIVLLWLALSGLHIATSRRFRLTIDGDEIRTNQGLLADQEERTTIERVEFVRVDTTVVGRRLGLERVEIGTGNDTMVIAPVQPLGEWRTLAEVVLGDRAGFGLPIEPISDRSVRRYRLRGAVLTTLACAGAAYWGWIAAVLVGAGVGLATIGWYPRARLKWFGLGGDDRLLLARTGFSTHRRWMFRIDRIDSTSRSATIGQRRAGLATISFSGRGSESKITIPDVAPETAANWDRRVASLVGTRIGPAGDGRPMERVAADAGECPPPSGEGSGLGAGGRPLPPAALRFNTFTSVSVAAVLLAAWFAAVGWALATRPADSLWRSPWLTVTGSVLLVVGSIGAVWMTRRGVRSERWSVDEKFVERRAGVIVRTSTRVKLDHVAVGRWAQGPLERRFGLGQVRLFTRGSANPDLTLVYLDQADARDIAELHRARGGATDTSRAATTD